jgi:hypothetical protein
VGDVGVCRSIACGLRRFVSVTNGGVSAIAFIALGRGMAPMSKDGETSRSGRIVVTFLKALRREP